VLKAFSHVGVISSSCLAGMLDSVPRTAFPSSADEMPFDDTSVANLTSNFGTPVALIEEGAPLSGYPLVEREPF
jgi:hypothetical protein